MLSSIIIDATHYSEGQSTGVENYVSALLPLLSTKLLAEGVSVAWIAHTETPKDLPDGVTWLKTPYTRFWSQTGLVKELKKHRPDLFFTPSGLPPLFYSGKTAVTVHDMSVYLAPEAYSFAQKLRLKTLLKWGARRAAVILTPSHYTADSVQEFWGTGRKCKVTPLALPSLNTEQVAIKVVDATKPVITFIGRIERKKNLLPVVEAMDLLRHTGAQLVLAGKDGFGSEAVHVAINALPEAIRKRIVVTGYLSDAEKAWLLHHSSLLIVPSLVEGFGIPVLEGFAATLPVVCARSGSLPEVGGEAASYVLGANSQEWADQWDLLLGDEKLRHSYAEAGRKRLKDFTWKETAEKTAQAFLALK